MIKKGFDCCGLWAPGNHCNNYLQVTTINEMLFHETRFKILSNSKILSLSIIRLVGMALVTTFLNF